MKSWPSSHFKADKMQEWQKQVLNANIEADTMSKAKTKIKAPEPTISETEAKTMVKHALQDQDVLDKAEKALKNAGASDFALSIHKRVLEMSVPKDVTPEKLYGYTMVLRKSFSLSREAISIFFLKGQHKVYSTI